MMTVCHIVPTFESGGAEQLVLSYARLLDPAKFRLHAISAVEGGVLEEEFVKSGTPVFVGSRKKHGGRLGALLAVLRYLKTVEPDIVHTHLISSDVIGFLWKWWSRKPVCWISTIHNVEHNRPLWYHVVWRTIFRFVDTAIVVSPVVGEYAKKVFRLTPQKTTLLLNGIEVERWSNGVHTPLFSRPTSFVLGTIGRLEEQKGHIYLLRALATIQEIPWEYHLFGDGSLKGALKREATTLGIGERLHWHDVVMDLPHRLHTIDCVIQPSLWEGLSLTVMEAMASGRAVIASKPAAAGLLEEGKTGWVVPAKDSHALAEVIRVVWQNKQQAQHIAAAAATFAQGHFDIVRHLDMLSHIYLGCDPIGKKSPKRKM